MKDKKKKPSKMTVSDVALVFSAITLLIVILSNLDELLEIVQNLIVIC